ncbi:MAG: carboxypeptidase regulatory-like domain-containing protein [Planctomycetes bacterium]|nr:carboxypeptidase regulatory-like domain-containing protein [Planctomycetota bacterium]
METARDIRVSPAGRMTCRVVNAAGIPIAGVSVARGPQTLRIRECTFSFDDEGYLPGEFRTDSEGRFNLEGFIPEGTLRLSLRHPGLAPRDVDVDLAGKGEQTLRMTEARPLAGSVTDAFGRPVPNVRFLFRTDLSDVGASLKALPGTTDELGRFAFEAGEAGSRMLVAWAPGHVPTTFDLSKSPARLNITLQAATGKLQGRVLSGKAGVPLAGARVTLSRMVFPGAEGHVELAFYELGAWWRENEEIRGYGVLSEGEVPPSTVTAEDGTFTLEGLPPGASVNVSHEGHGTQEIVVPASGTLEVRLGILGGE